MRSAPSPRPADRDVADPDDVAQLVRRFYQAAIPDPLLGPLFEFGGIEWEVHIPRIVAFWERQLLGIEGWAGNMPKAHAPVMTSPRFGREALARWVELWCETVDEDFVGPVADHAKVRAQQVAGVLATLHERGSVGAVPIELSRAGASRTPPTPR